MKDHQHAMLGLRILATASSFVVVASAALLAGCANDELGKPPAPSKPVAVVSTAPFPQVKTLRLSDDPDPALPDVPGRETVQVSCGMCHTTRYIMTQPPFSREVWTTEVTKMRKTFSGPIPEEQVPQIVAYLVAVNGVPSPPKK